MSTSHRIEDTSTVYIFNNEKSKLLLIYHNKFLKWLPPGGHVEDVEAYSNAAEREVKEEIGVDIKLEKIIFNNANNGYLEQKIYPSKGEEFCIVEEIIEESTNDINHIHIDHIFISFLDENIELIIDYKEISKYKWFAIDQIESIDTFDNVKKVCGLILNEMKS